MRYILLLCLFWPGTLLRADGLSIGMAAVEQEAKAEMVKRYRSQHPALTRIEIIRVSPGIKPPTGSDALRVRLPEPLPLARRVLVSLEAMRGEQIVARLPLWFEVQAFQMSGITTRVLHPHQIVQSGDLEFHEIDVVGKMSTVQRMNAIANQRVSRYLPAGHLLRLSDLEPIPAVLADQLVSVRIQTGTLVIESSGIAEQSGMLGQVIRVRNPSSDARYQARVMGNQQVEVATR